MKRAKTLKKKYSDLKKKNLKIRKTVRFKSKTLSMFK